MKIFVKEMEIWLQIRFDKYLQNRSFQLLSSVEEEVGGLKSGFKCSIYLVNNPNKHVNHSLGIEEAFAIFGF